MPVSLKIPVVKDIKKAFVTHNDQRLKVTTSAISAEISCAWNYGTLESSLRVTLRARKDLVTLTEGYDHFDGLYCNIKGKGKGVP